MYTCGPTVWNFAHVGNLRAFLFYDLLRRHLRRHGLQVTHVMNLTDIDDRILDQARRAQKTIAEYVEPYVRAFFEDLATLRAQPAEHYPRPTEHIPEMVALVARLLEKGNAYLSEGDVYFRIASFPAYGKLSRLDPAGLKVGARVSQDRYDKESATDFALWKHSQDADELIGAAWEAPFGRGRPGWHLECSAMAMKYLGETVDIHCGGVDLLFPHHENEIAQSEAATGKTFVRCWLHSEHVFDATGEKMSKSLRNFATLRDLLAAGHDPLAIRYFLLAGGHYRTRLRLSEESLHGAAEQVRRLAELAWRVANTTPAGGDDTTLVRAAESAAERFRSALDDDLNLPQGMGQVFELVREANAALDAGRVGARGLAALKALLGEVDAYLDVLGERPALDREVEQLIAEREAARAARDFGRADRIRERLQEQGVLLDDTREGVRWRRSLPARGEGREGFAPPRSRGG